MLPRDSQFSTTPFVFPLFTLAVSRTRPRPLSYHLQLSGLPRLSPPAFHPHPAATAALFLPFYPRGLLSHFYVRLPLQSQRMRPSRQEIVIVKRADRNARVTILDRERSRRDIIYTFRFNCLFKYAFVQFSIVHIRHSLLMKLQEL